MEWLELKIDTSPSGLDAVTALLEQQGITGVIIDDEADFKDFLEHNRQYWDYVDEDLLREKAGVSRVTFYLERNEDALNIVAQVRIAMSALKKEHPEYGPMLLTIDNVADADWENNWKKFYKPMEIGERLLVVPQWEETKARGRMKLVLNPGLTFGTGSHATTRLCLQSLDKYIHGGERVLDLGCGSGILSIAALVLGAREAFACDIDEKCVDVAYENAALNGIGKDRYTVRWGDVLTDKALQAEFGGGAAHRKEKQSVSPAGGGGLVPLPSCGGCRRSVKREKETGRRDADRHGHTAVYGGGAVRDAASDRPCPTGGCPGGIPHAVLTRGGAVRRRPRDGHGQRQRRGGP